MPTRPRHTRRQTRRLLHFTSPGFPFLPFAGVNPNAYPGAPGIIGPNALQHAPQFGTSYKGGGDYFSYNFAAFTPALPPADRQSFYGSYVRDLCDKYLTVFADFKFVRSYFDSSLAQCRLRPTPSRSLALTSGLVRVVSACQSRIRSIRSRSPMRRSQISFPMGAVFR